jgi:hypothetical protein
VRLTIIQLSTFVTDWRRLKLNDDDLRALEAIFLADPARGPTMSGTGGLRKLRFAPPSWHAGKSGATRVGYAYLPEHAAVFLVVIYSKDEKDNLTHQQRNQMKALLARVKESLSKGP